MEHFNIINGSNDFLSRAKNLTAMRLIVQTSLLKAFEIEPNIYVTKIQDVIGGIDLFIYRIDLNGLVHYKEF